jgi:hypothetical protein
MAKDTCSDSKVGTLVAHCDSQHVPFQCRFGERGVTSVTHYDSGRNMVGITTQGLQYAGNLCASKIVHFSTFPLELCCWRCRARPPGIIFSWRSTYLLIPSTSYINNGVIMNEYIAKKHGGVDPFAYCDFFAFALKPPGICRFSHAEDCTR